MTQPDTDAGAHFQVSHEMANETMTRDDDRQGQRTMRVSVVCPVYNTAPDLLRAAVSSVLTQSAGDVGQLILANDCSTDPRTTQALAELAAGDPRIIVHRTDRNGGPARARNLAMALATSPWVAFLDADDLWLPNHLADAQAASHAFPAAEWFACAHLILGPDGAQTAIALLSDAHAGDPVAPGVVRYAPPASTHALIGNYWLHLGGCVVKADLARRAGGFSDRCFYSEDWLFFLCLSTSADLYFLPAPGYLLRRQHASLTTSTRRLTRHRASGKRAALAHPKLTPFKRPLRWALRSTYKGLAANNVLAGRRIRGSWFALQAFAMDPREIGEAMQFLRLVATRDREQMRIRAPAYTSAELTFGD